MIEEIKDLLDDYYGNSRDDDHKQDVAEFIRNYSYELLAILKANQYES